MRVLCYGATGVQGGPVPSLLAERGHQVRVVVRSPEEFRSAPNIEVVQGALGDPASLNRASAGIDAAFLVLPLLYDEERVVSYLDSVVAAARAGGARRIVLNTSTRIPSMQTEVPAFEIKRRLERRLDDCGMEFASLRPTFYLENLLLPTSTQRLFSDGVLTYSLPAERATAWMSARDVARFCVAALESDVTGSCFDLAGPEAITGHDLADRFSRRLGRAVRYESADLEEFQSQLEPFLGVDAATEVAKLNRWWRANSTYDLGFTGDAEGMRRRFGLPQLETVDAWLTQQVWAAEPGGRGS